MISSLTRKVAAFSLLLTIALLVAAPVAEASIGVTINPPGGGFNPGAAPTPTPEPEIDYPVVMPTGLTFVLENFRFFF